MTYVAIALGILCAFEALLIYAAMTIYVQALKEQAKLKAAHRVLQAQHDVLEEAAIYLRATNASLKGRVSKGASAVAPTSYLARSDHSSKLESLLTLAVRSSNIDEARNAALMYCKRIAKLETEEGR